MAMKPVGLSRDLGPRRVMRAEVDGQDMAIWRDGDGALHAWNNRCPHRGMRLSHGFVRGDRLACLYHGWQFGKDGRCAYIPAHPDLEPPETIRTTPCGVTEQAGVIWAGSTDETTAPTLPEGLIPLRSMGLRTKALRVTNALAGTSFEGTLPEQLDESTFLVGAHRLVVLLHAKSDQETDLHVLVQQPAEAARLKVLSRWCETVRREAEGRTREAAA